MLGAVNRISCSPAWCTGALGARLHHVHSRRSRASKCQCRVRFLPTWLAEPNARSAPVRVDELDAMASFGRKVAFAIWR
jgi:hypothetical protein